MTDKRDFKNGCLPGNWIEFEVKDTEQQDVVAKSTNRKDLDTLVAELSEIKEAFELLEDKKIRLQNLMRFYRGEFVNSF